MDAVTARASRAGRTKTASEEESPKFCIFGAGAIGGMIATLLARSGATVSVVARGQTLAALNRDGVRLVINGQMCKRPSKLARILQSLDCKTM